MVLIKNLAEDG